MDDSVYLILLRHGRSLADDEGVHEGRYDSPLTDVGRQQAGLLATYWQAHPPGFGMVVSSSLRRAEETARIVCEPMGLTRQVSDLWQEFDNGPFAGLSEDEAAERYPVPAFRHDFSPFTADGGESQAQVRARALKALHHLWTMPTGNLLVVSHGGMLNIVLSELTGASRAWFRFSDTGFARLRLSRSSHTAWVLGIDERPHHPPPVRQ